jgi:hypothetical protein
MNNGGCGMNLWLNITVITFGVVGILTLIGCFVWTSEESIAVKNLENEVRELKRQIEGKQDKYFSYDTYLGGTDWGFSDYVSPNLFDLNGKKINLLEFLESITRQLHLKVKVVPPKKSKIVLTKDGEMQDEAVVIE